MLKLTDITVPTRLSSISVSTSSGRLIHVLGPNGAGKSTLLSVIAGLTASDGKVELNNKEIGHFSAKELARLRAYLSQQQENSSMMPVFQYIALHQPQNAQAREVEEVVMFLCVQLELCDKLSRPLSKLSGGEWQRVRLAAIFLQVWPSLNKESKLLLLDEPTNSLDIAQQAALDRLLSLFCGHGRTAIVSAHNLNHTLQHAEEVWLLNKGRLINYGKTAEVMTPNNLESIFNIGFKLLNVNALCWLTTDSQKRFGEKDTKNID